jgi:hypothetical protein
MRNRAVRRHHATRGEALVFALILLGIGAGLLWWLFSSRAKSQDAAFAFAREATTRIALEHDRKFLDGHLAPSVQTIYPPSFRERMIDRLKQFGSPVREPEIEGQVSFRSHFFSPSGHFYARLAYPDASKAVLDLTVSNRHGWRIDEMNLIWYPPEQPLAAPPPPAPATAAPTATTSPSATGAKR